jgi:hypothetical protein
MIILRYIGYAALAISVLLAFVILSEGELGFIAPSISLAISGVLFIAFDKVIETLCEIRDLLTPSAKEVEEETIIAEPTKTLAELEAGIQSAKKRT